MLKWGITPTGFERKRLDQIRADLFSRLSEGWGVDVAQNPESKLNVLVTEFADKIAELWEVGEEIYHSQYPSSATGISLDNAVEYGGIRRIGNQKTYYSILCTGDDGTEIPEGTLLSSTTKPPVRFMASGWQSISRGQCNQISIKVVGLQDNIYTVGINGNIYSVPGGDKPTVEGILYSLQAQISGDTFNATVDGDHLVIEDRNLQRNNSILLSENLTTESVSSLIPFCSENFGKYMLPDGSISQIITNVTGLKKCINLVPPIYGRLRETDTELRKSYIKRIAVRSSYMLESITSAILDSVQGVEGIAAYQNDTNLYDDEGRPPHSVEIIVDGGSDLGIAKEILAKKASGIESFGEVRVEVPEMYGGTMPICFNRPQYVYIWLKVSLTVNPEQALPPNYVELTKQSIVEQAKGVEMGKSLLTQRLIGDIFRKVTGIAFVKFAAASSVNAGEVPTEYEHENIAISSRQKAVIEEKRIEVELIGNVLEVQ